MWLDGGQKGEAVGRWACTELKALRGSDGQPSPQSVGVTHQSLTCQLVLFRLCQKNLRLKYSFTVAFIGEKTLVL